MSFTRATLVTAFPALAEAGERGAAYLRQRLAYQLCAFTDNVEYAVDIARVLISHVDDAPYSSLPHKLQSYRASIDLFVFCAPDALTTTYLRSIARALELKRNARRFHQSLLASARKHNLPIPDRMLAEFEDPPSYSCRVRLPLPVYKSLLAQAKATRSSVSQIIRTCVLSNFEEIQTCLPTPYET